MVRWKHVVFQLAILETPHEDHLFRISTYHRREGREMFFFENYKKRENFTDVQGDILEKRAEGL